MRGILENLVVTAFAAAVVLSRARKAPGPTEEQVAEKEAATANLQAAQEVVDQAPPEQLPDAQRKLEEALRRLAVAEEELRAAEEDLRNYPVPEYLKEAAAQGKVMIAVTGASGSGKSSWINAVRRRRPGDPDGAKVGINETTLEPTMYSFRVHSGGFRKAIGGLSRAVRRWTGREEDDPIKIGDRLLLLSPEELKGKAVNVLKKEGPDELEVELVQDESAGQKKLVVQRNQLAGVLSECVLWDLPGVGTDRFPQDTYLRDMGIRHFDMVVLLSAGRFTEAEVKLADEMRYWGVPFFLIRNKIDLDIASEIEKLEEQGKNLSKRDREEISAKTIQKVKDYFRRELNERVYCITLRAAAAVANTPSLSTIKDDFQELESDMEKALQEQRLISQEEAQG